MRTFMFLLILLLLTALIAQIDVYLYKTDIIHELKYVYGYKPGTNKWIVHFILLVGLLYCIITEIKGKLQKNRKKIKNE